MARRKKQAAPKDPERTYSTLQVDTAIKKVLKKEQTKIFENGEGFKSMSTIVAGILAEHFGDNAEYMKLLREAGLLD